MASILKTVGSGLNVQERKHLETTGVMAKHWILDFLFLSNLVLLFFSYQMRIIFNLKIIFCKLIIFF